MRTLIDGGYIEGGAYHYYLTDHLGNNRAVFTGNGQLVQRTQYYPFGMAFADKQGEQLQPYKYNGKELDTRLQLNTYDYAARYMDPAIGRFTSMDPHAENYFSWSPYVYVGNNPMRRTDPSGKDWEEELTDFVRNDGTLVARYSDGNETIVNVDALPETIVTPYGNGNTPVSTGGVLRMYNYNTGELSGPIGEVGLNNIHPEFTLLFLGRGIVNSTIKGASSGIRGTNNLGNPFKDKTLNQVSKAMDNQVKKGKLEVKVKDSVTGKSKIYQNKKSGYSYNLDKGNTARKGSMKKNVQPEKPHIDVNYPKPKPKDIPKKKLPVKE